MSLSSEPEHWPQSGQMFIAHGSRKSVSFGGAQCFIQLSKMFRSSGARISFGCRFYKHLVPTGPMPDEKPMALCFDERRKGQ
jgi:hypothetical protein